MSSSNYLLPSAASETPGENPSVKVEVRDGVGWIMLTRPDQINAINDDIRIGVPAALALLDKDPAVTAIVVAGEGERGFCAGADIKEKRGPETSIQVRRRMEKRRWIEALDRTEKPVIAAIHGYCMGGGMEFALGCDIRMAAPGAVFALPETGLGLIPGGGGTQRLGRVVGLGRALDLLLTGDRISLDEAQRIGLVTRVSTSKETLLQEAHELAVRIAKKPPTATLFDTQAAKAAAELDLKSGLDLELDLFALLVPMEDVKEAALAFKEKRAPQFVGR
jgi:enoyl-CoA hydratase/carnithine racemase